MTTEDLHRLQSLRNTILWTCFWDVKYIPERGPIRRALFKRSQRAVKHMRRLDAIYEKWYQETINKMKSETVKEETR